MNFTGSPQAIHGNSCNPQPEFRSSAHLDGPVINDTFSSSGYIEGHHRAEERLHVREALHLPPDHAQDRSLISRVPPSESGRPTTIVSKLGTTIEIAYNGNGRFWPKGLQPHYPFDCFVRTPGNFFELLKGNDWWCPLCATCCDVETIYPHLVAAHTDPSEESPYLMLPSPTEFRDSIAASADGPRRIVLWESGFPTISRLWRSTIVFCVECLEERDSSLDVRIHATAKGHAEAAAGHLSLSVSRDRLVLDRLHPGRAA
ncbi:unnamed protein product [Zymoseptoria tritici ST99CH_1A5]|uniref:Uncharacterized protein n=1 Tax=Zymoseptoria tritici ST99CH_1A5 TaxID=1276529 RepID=A0A1Y6M3K0_ZYMTR|nr:unnamed protein product [Zymoseptoria tritici ST99CH_1A5]